MTDFLIKQLPYDLSSHAGLAFIGQYLKRININALIDPAFPVRSGISNSDILKSYLGLLCLGKNDFDAIESFRGNAFFMRALGLQAVPPGPTLRQRLDTRPATGLSWPRKSTRRSFIIKWNPRKTPVETVAAGKVADAGTAWQTLRPGKRECIWQDRLDLLDVGNAANPARRVYRLTERTIDKHGHALLLPEYVLEGWTTTLPGRFSKAEIIALYADHATHEQFHAEFKSDMDLERLPSGKFDTNYLVCRFVAVAMNLLRLIGQNTLNGPDAPVRHPAQRRRIRTVLQEMMFKAARMIRHAGRWVLGLGAGDSGFAVFDRHYGQLRTA